jgi:hypothetical protein
MSTTPALATNICSTLGTHTVSPLSPVQRDAMARALNRAAEHFDNRAKLIDQRVANWRKGRPGDDSPVVAHTLHGVAGQLRRWADQCVHGTQDGGQP